MHQALGQPCHLYGEYLLTSVNTVGSLGHKGQRVNTADQLEVARLHRMGTHDMGHLTNGSIGKRTVAAALIAQAFYIHLGNGQLGLQGETLGLGQQMAILKNHAITCIYHILGALAKATTAIDIARYGAGTLLRHKTLEIMMLAQQRVAGRQVEDMYGLTVSKKGRVVEGLAEDLDDAGQVCSVIREAMYDGETEYI